MVMAKDVSVTATSRWYPVMFLLLLVASLLVFLWPMVTGARQSTHNDVETPQINCKGICTCNNCVEKSKHGNAKPVSQSTSYRHWAKQLGDSRVPRISNLSDRWQQLPGDMPAGNLTVTAQAGATRVARRRVISNLHVQS
jgi:hypothetical protein